MANTHSLDLEASSSQYAYITDANQTGLDITGDFTIEAWVKLESLDETATIYAKSKSGGSELAFKIQDTGKIYSSYRNSSSNLSRSFSNNAVFSGASNWTHLAVTCDVSEKDFKFYVNGSQVDDTNDYSLASSIGNNEANVGIGAEIVYNGSIRNYLDGLIDDVRVWNDIRTPEEIADNYQKELVGDEAGLVGYWKFNNSAVDETANNNDLTLSGSPSYSTDVPPWNLTLAVDTMALALTYADVTLKKAIKLVVDTMALSFTFADVIFNNALTLIVDTMALSLTYADVTLKKAVKLVVDTMSLILDFKNVILKKIGWNNDTKPSDTWTNDSK